MKRRIPSLWIAAFSILLIISCLSSENTIATFVDETKSVWTIPPTYSPYPTYTVEPASIREITRIVVITKTQVPTPTKTDWREPTANTTSTSLPTVDLSTVPSWIINGADVAGMEPNEVVYLFNLIQKVARDRDPYPLFEFLRFPLHEAAKCPGDIIETPDEFITRFPSLMTESTRANILKRTLDDIFLSWRGMAMEANYRYDIWFLAYCEDSRCKSHRIVLESFLKYRIFWEMVEGNPDPTPC